MFPHPTTLYYRVHPVLVSVNVTLASAMQLKQMVHVTLCCYWPVNQYEYLVVSEKDVLLLGLLWSVK